MNKKKATSDESLLLFLMKIVFWATRNMNSQEKEQ
jgi:hypothetical protein